MQIGAITPGPNGDADPNLRAELLEVSTRFWIPGAGTDIVGSGSCATSSASGRVLW
jgi:hypothetical protein